MCLQRTWKTSCLIVKNRETDRFYSTKGNYIVDNMIVSSSWQGWRGGGAIFHLWNIPEITYIVKVNQGGYIEGGETWTQTGAPVRVRSSMKWFLCFCGQHNGFLIGFHPSQCWIGGGMPDPPDAWASLRMRANTHFIQPACWMRILHAF